MKKRVVKMMILFTVGLGLVGCTGKTADEFVGRMESVNNKKNNDMTVDISLSDIEMTTENSQNPMVNMLVTQLKETKISIHNIRDSKEDSLVETNVQFDLMGMSIPMSLVGSMKETPKMYLSTDSLSSIMEIVQSVSGETSPVDQETLNSLKGKYIDISDLSENQNKTNTLTDLGKELSVNEKFNQAYAKEVVSYIKSLDAKTFEKKDNKITHTFTFDEIKEMIKLSDKVIKSNDEFKTMDTTDSKTVIEDLVKEFKDVSVKLAVDTKKNTMDFKVNMKPAEDTNDSGLKKLVMSGKVSSKSSKETVTLPSKDKIISSEEINKLTTSGQQTTKISDEEFSEFLKAAKAGKENGTITEETQKEVLEAYKEILTDEQYKQLEEALK
ncbi:hypothetical protein [Vagococcus bubulae]|uniref:Lipoprotein n=1 Tax=Vagococcus bubulae TaxID=1977868 RepID=A0A429ZHD2_9ENTE|nr:hypothetical protein [Vagococcus bubulae]RST93115.1 hypothetical protein CBF36_07835 [Vagococcus bubulae]